MAIRRSVWFAALALWLALVVNTASAAGPDKHCVETLRGDFPSAREGPPQRQEVFLRAMLHCLYGDHLPSALGLAPRIKVTARKEPSARALKSGVINVSAGLLEILSSADEVAFIVAHEVAHLVDHRASLILPTNLTGQRSPSALLEDEMRADSHAQAVSCDQGFSAEAATAVLSRLETLGRDSGLSLGTARPGLQTRIAAIQNGPSSATTFE